MRLKILTFIVGTMMCMMTFIGMANVPGTESRGTPEIGISRVNPATDGTRCALVGNIANGISYFWEQSEAFSSSVSVATIGTNTKGIAIDTPGAWIYNAAYGQCSADMGSIWDIWTAGEPAVQVYEVFNDQSVSGRNYTMIFEATVVGVGSTSFGANNAQNALTAINDPILVGAWSGNNTAMISIAPQTTGFEVATLFDGYRVFKSPNPITQTNQGTALGDANLEGGNWVYRDTAFTVSSYYAVKVKWDGGTYPFYAPLYSYGMSNDILTFPPPPGPTAVNLAASPNPHNGNIASEQVTIIATITDFDFDILSGEYRVDGGSWMSFPQNGVSPLAVASVFNFPNGYTEGAHTYQVRGFDGYVYGSIASSSFTITDTTAPLVLWNIKPGATSLVNQAMYFNAGYGDFRPYNPNVAASFFQYRVNNGTWTNVAWVNSSFIWGSYQNILAYTIPGNTFAAGNWVDYRGQMKDTATTPNTAMLSQGSCQIISPTPSFSIPVVWGWNLISFPVTASGSPATVLNDAGGNTAWNVVKWYNPQTPADPWKTYRIGSTVNDLTYIDNTMGLWIYIINPGWDNMLCVEGNNPGTVQIQLKAGWNMVGYPTNVSDAVGNVFWGTGVDNVEVFDPAEPSLIKEVGPTYVMNPGKGYWVHVPSDTVWTVTSIPVIPDPYSIYGTVYLYDGRAATGYNPLVSSGGASVNVTWWNPFAGWVSIVSNTSPIGQFMVDITNYLDGGLVYVNATFDAPYNNNGYNYTYINSIMGGSNQNVVCGVPHGVRITNPVNQSMTMSGVPFIAIYEIFDVDGDLAQGFFTFADGMMEWSSSDPLFIPPSPKSFSGTSLGGNGQAMAMLILQTPGTMWINISEGGSGELNPYLTPWGNFYIDPYGTEPGWLCDWAYRVLFVI
jgi:hypothetical protein